MLTTFLRGEWRKLAMANYVVDPKLLEPYLPAMTELDLWNGNCYVSLVGFMFLKTKLAGFAIPFYTNFEEVNLRFYVRYKEKKNWKRGVVFVKEIVPKHALRIVANTFYKEKYETLPMKHSWQFNGGEQLIEYQWMKKNRWNSFKMKTSMASYPVTKGSEEEFITEHYWGYTKINQNKTSEYRVEHPVWQVYQTLEYEIDVDFGTVYGPDFGFLTRQKVNSVFLAEGSLIEVKTGKMLTDQKSF